MDFFGFPLFISSTSVQSEKKALNATEKKGIKRLRKFPGFFSFGTVFGYVGVIQYFFWHV
jgi:hypothetical protein